MAASDALLEALARRPDTPGVANPYAGPAGAWRRENLARYLAAVTGTGGAEHTGEGRAAGRGTSRPGLGVVLVGEAPGYRGCAVTGVPFTSRQVLGSDAGRWGLFAPAGFVADEGMGRPWAEATATLVWRHLPAALGALPRPPLLWNAFPFHPHPRDSEDPGDAGDSPGGSAGNRGLTAAELAEGAIYLRMALDLCPGGRPIAVGRVAATALARLGITPLAVLRHPAHGGAAAFAAGLLEAARTLLGSVNPRSR